MPGPVGTGITPFLISKFGVYQDSFLAGPRGQVRVVLFTPENFQILAPVAPATTL